MGFGVPLGVLLNQPEKGNLTLQKKAQTYLAMFQEFEEALLTRTCSDFTEIVEISENQDTPSIYRDDQCTPSHLFSALPRQPKPFWAPGGHVRLAFGWPRQDFRQLRVLRWGVTGVTVANGDGSAPYPNTKALARYFLMATATGDPGTTQIGLGKEHKGGDRRILVGSVPYPPVTWGFIVTRMGFDFLRAN